MKIKGSSVIELTDVNTGKVQSFKDENLVTAAVQKALAFHFGLMEKQSMVANAAASALLPVVPNAIGGILCYEDRLDENPGVFYADPDNKIVGCASNDSHSTTSSIRGSLNAIESGPLEDGKGYRFVFDFNTAQGNGTISAIALTSRQGGVSGYGDHENPYRCAKDIGEYNININTSNYEQYIDLITALMYAVSVRYEKNDLISIIPLATGDLKIVSVPFPVTKVDLTGSYFADGITYRTIATVTPSDNFFSGAAGETSKTKFYGSFFDGEDGYWWGFSYKGRSSNGPLTVYWAKINQETFEITEGTWTLNNINTRGYSSVPFSQSLSASYWTSSTSTIRNNSPLTCGGGYLYMLNYNMNTVYKINISNPTDITAIKIKDVSTTDNDTEAKPFQRMKYIHGRVYLPTGFIDADNMFTEAVINWSGSDGMQLPVTRKDQIYGFSFGKTVNVHMRPVLVTPYLATINNLAKPVVKTADKTMKITYILREE